MYKRHTGQVSMLGSPEMFGSLPLDPNNDWIKLSSLVPWQEFDVKYADHFRSKKGQRAVDSRMALGALLIKPAYKALSDEDITKEIAMNPYQRIFTISMSALNREMEHGSRKTGVKRIRIHNLRHSAISLLIDMGFSATAIADRVGRESIHNMALPLSL